MEKEKEKSAKLKFFVLIRVAIAVSRDTNEERSKMHSNESKQVFCVITQRVSRHTVALFPFVVREATSTISTFIAGRASMCAPAVNMQLISIIKILLSFLQRWQVLCGQRLPFVMGVLRSQFSCIFKNHHYFANYLTISD